MSIFDPYKFGDNEKPLEYHSGNGTIFKSDRLDMINGVDVDSYYDVASGFYIQDLCEFIAYHALNIHKFMNGFQGYNCISFRHNKRKITKNNKKEKTKWKELIHI